MGRHHDLGGEDLGRVGCVEVHRDGLLGEMRMLATLVDLKLGGHLTAHLVLGKHALDGLLDDRFGATGQELDEGLFAETTGETGVAAIELLVRLEAGEDDLFGIDDDDVIAHIDVGGVEDVELAGEDGGGLGGEAAERFAAGVEHEPLTLNIFAARNGGGHRWFYSLILPSSVFGVANEEGGVSLVIREKSIVSIAAGQGGIEREENVSLRTRGRRTA